MFMEALVMSSKVETTQMFINRMNKLWYDHAIKFHTSLIMNTSK